MSNGKKIGIWLIVAAVALPVFFFFFVIPAGFMILMESVFGYSDANKYVREEQVRIKDAVVSDVDDFNGSFAIGSSEREVLNQFLDNIYQRKFGEYSEDFYLDPEHTDWELVEVPVDETVYTQYFIDLMAYLISHHNANDDLILRFSNASMEPVIVTLYGRRVSNSRHLRAEDIVTTIKTEGVDAFKLEAEDTSYITGHLVLYEMVYEEVERVPVPDLPTTEAIQQFIDSMLEEYGYEYIPEENVLVKHDYVEREFDRVWFDTSQEDWTVELLLDYQHSGYEMEDVTEYKQETLKLFVDETFLETEDATSYSWMAARSEESIEELAGLLQYADEFTGTDKTYDGSGVLVRSEDGDYKLPWNNISVEEGDPDSFIDLGEEGASGGVGSGAPLSEADIAAIKNSWSVHFPDLEEDRKAVCEWAFESVGKFTYAWGAAANGPGYENAKRSFDCSHYVCWVFWSTLGQNFGNSGTGAMGNGGTMYEISSSELRPGDLAFKKRPGSASSRNNANHVLIFVGYNTDGEAVYVHCMSGAGTVCTTYGNAAYFYRPVYFD